MKFTEYDLLTAKIAYDVENSSQKALRKQMHRLIDDLTSDELEYLYTFSHLRLGRSGL